MPASGSLFVAAMQSISALSGDDYLCGTGQDMKIQPRRPVANVVTIEPNSIPATYRVSSGALPQAGEARGNTAIQGEIAPIGWYLFFHDGAWTDQAHLTPPNVPELG